MLTARSLRHRRRGDSQFSEGRLVMSLWVVVGGQYGSEGKGKVSAFITKQENIDICVRCGGANSRHSFVYEHGKKNVLRQLTTCFVNPRTPFFFPPRAQIQSIILRPGIYFSQTLSPHISP